MDNAQWSKSRNIVARMLITGKLIFTTPVAFGSGSDEGMVDMPINRDPLEGKALLTGATIAGALRSYLREYEHGYGDMGNNEDLCSKLFGASLDDKGSEQGWIIVNDSLGAKPLLELRDGVRIDSKTRTAEDRKKFDFELIEEGAEFDLEFEVLLPKDEKLQAELLRGLVICLEGLEKGEISFGIRKNRGFGRCVVKEWKLCHYDLKQTAGLINWLKNSDEGSKNDKIANIIKDISHKSESITDKREKFLLNATFSLDGSLLIRSDSINPDSPDTVHLHSKRNKTPVPVLTGTSLAGALRARGLRIANTVCSRDNAKCDNAKKLLDELFGTDMNDTSSLTPSASKIIVNENVITNSIPLVQNRIKIDRFTGGSFPSALFSEQPVFGQKETEIQIELMIKQPSDAHIGLLLLLLKDLWTCDLPLGGGISVGRGRLKGKKAKLIHKKNSGVLEWELVQESSTLKLNGNKDELEKYVNSFVVGVSV